MDERERERRGSQRVPEYTPGAKRMREWIKRYFYEWFAVATILDLLLLSYIAYWSHH
jgi:hypothetical protein